MSKTNRKQLIEFAENYLQTIPSNFNSSTLDDILPRALLRVNTTFSSPFDEKEILEIYSDVRKDFLNKEKKDVLVFLKASEIKSKPIDWLWEGKIAKGKVTLIAGNPGLGKSQLTIYLAGVVSNGGIFPGGHKCKEGSVLFFSAEDDAEDTITPRLEAVKANREKVHIFSTVKTNGKDKFFDLSRDIELLENTLKKDEDISFIIVDPITAFLGETDSHVNAEVRALLASLSKLASKYGVAVLVVTHLNKSTGGNAMNQITGSLAFVAAARAAYMVLKDENDESRRLFLPVKNNLAEDVGGFAFRVEGVNVEDYINTSRIVWEPEGVTMTATEAMKVNKEVEGGVSKETIKWLEDLLQKHPEGLEIENIVKTAIKNGISRSTLYRAKRSAFVDNVPLTGKAKMWKLNKDFDDVTQDALDKF